MKVRLLLIAGTIAVVGLVIFYMRNDRHSASITVAVRSGLEADGIKQLAATWGQRRAVEVSVQVLGRDNYEVDVTNDLLSGRPKYDVIFFPSTLVAEMVSKEALAPITGWDPQKDTDMLAYSAYKSRIYGLPCDISSFFLYFRRDLIKHVPETWEELIQAAAPLSKIHAPGSPTAYGLAFGGKAGEDLFKGFLPILWSYGGFLEEGASVGVDTDGGIEAAKLLRKMVVSGSVPPDIQSWEVVKIFEELQRGTVAMSAPQWNALYPLIKGGTSQYKDAIDIAPIPGVRQPDGTIRRVDFQHTWVLVQSQHSGVLPLTNEFILYATGAEGGRLYAQSARGNPARASILSDTELQKSRPEFPLLLEALKTAKAEPSVPYYARMARTMNDALSSIIAGSKEPAAAMREAASQLRTLVSQQ